MKRPIKKPKSIPPRVARGFIRAVNGVPVETMLARARAKAAK